MSGGGRGKRRGGEVLIVRKVVAVVKDDCEEKAKESKTDGFDVSIYHRARQKKYTLSSSI